MKKHIKRTNTKENIGKLLLDLGKLVFGAFFLGSVLQGGMSHDILALVGIVVAIILFIIGIWATSKIINSEEIISSKKEEKWTLK